jgi:hypothetical protein
MACRARPITEGMKDGPFDGCDEAEELLMPMAGHAAADDLAFEHAERGEQGRRAVAFVIVREGCAVAPIWRKTRLGLDLAFLVDGDHYRVACIAKPNILIVDGHVWGVSANCGNSS